jgi:alcohol dehydrogenase (NADP+)
MKSERNEKKGNSAPVMPSRREILVGGLGLVAAPLLANVATNAYAREADQQIGNAPLTCQAYGAASATSPLGPMQIKRRALGPKDVLLDVLYCGVCHTDIHFVKGEWAGTPYPCVPGHEVIGRVQAVGSEVTKFRVGDIGGVGCMVDSCGTCVNCLDDLEQYCLNHLTLTYNSDEPATGGHTFGGYSDKIVVTEHFVISIPPGADLAATAPLLCAGVTTFSPMQHWNLQGGQRVGIIGLGGLGHVAVKLAVARRADVTVFTTSPGKRDDAQRLGAKKAVLWSDTDAMKQLAGQFDLLIATVPQAFPLHQFLDVLKLNGTLINLGAMEQLQDVSGHALALGRKSVAGSVIGGIAETQEVIDYCTSRNIKADVEMIRIEDINGAYDRIMKKDVRYRFVIDMASLKKAGAERS